MADGGEGEQQSRCPVTAQIARAALVTPATECSSEAERRSGGPEAEIAKFSIPTISQRVAQPSRAHGSGP